MSNRRALWLLAIGLLFAALLGLLCGRRASADQPDAGLAPSVDVRLCTCVEGPAGAEIERLRREVRLLRHEKLVNDGIKCAEKKRGKR